MPNGIVQIVQRLRPGGIEVLALELSSRLAGQNAILSLEWTPLEIVGNWPMLAGLPTLIVGMAKKPGVRPGLLLPLLRRIRALAPRAVMTHHIGPLLYGGLAARLAGVPIIVHVEHDVWHYANPNHRRLARLAGVLVHPHVVAVSETVARTMRELMPSAHVSVISNAVDTDRFIPGDRAAARRRLGLPLDRPIIGAAGRLEEVKGQDVLLRAVAAIPQALLVLAGDGTQAAVLKQMAAELGMAERVVFLGYRDDMDTIYPAFDVVALPSRNEGLPLSVLEAQACDIPVVASDVGSVHEAICPQGSRLVPPDDPAALGAALSAMLETPPAIKPRAFVLERFSWARTVAAYQRILTSPNP
ncbi:glycosyltransferase [Azorhizobium sp. AG788]|uniref:glycosyltransferase n=1 Tax=Azorhizobium sp. AG788 TaxID=2183897 RepID=UPI0031394C64